MEYYVVQTALLLLAAYVLGAFVGCLLRRLIRPGGNRGTGPDGHLKTGSAYAGAMDQPAITTSNAQSTTAASSTSSGKGQSPRQDTDAARFENALTGAEAGASSAGKDTSGQSGADAASGAAEGKSGSSDQNRSQRNMSPVATAAAAAAATMAARHLPSIAPTEKSASAPITTTEPSQSPIAASKDNDDLTLIRGIEAAQQFELNGLGTSTFKQIAGWSAADVDGLPHAIKDRVSADNWIEQAQILAGGGTTEYARLRLTGAAPDTVPVQAATPAEPSEKDTTPLVSSVTPTLQASNAQAAVETPVAANDDDTRNLTGLRSVRSEAFRSSPGAGSSLAGGEPDDLKRIRGVGLLIEKKLNSLGVTSYEQVANWSAAEIDRMSQLLDFKGRIERENWVEQARILASGGHTEFSRRADND